MTRSRLGKVNKGRAYLILLFLTLFCFVLVVMAGLISRRIYLDDELARARATLSSHATNLQNALDKYRVLTPLIARMPDVTTLLADPLDPDMQGLLSSIQNLAGLTRLEILDTQGRLLAGAQDDHLEGTMPGQRGAAFEKALQGRLGRDFISGVNGGRYYLFAAPIRKDGAILGVIRIRVPLEDIEQAWALSRDPILAVDPSGRVFLSNRAAWRLQPFEAITGHASDDPDLEAARLPVLFPVLGLSTRNVSLDLPLLEWRLHVLVDTSRARALSISVVTISALMALFVVLGAWILTERVIRRNEAARKALADALRLERRVRDRTRDLTQANRQLALEVRDRETAEDELRKAQAELVQTAKLAALGQMSAMIAHEFNQPLGALRSYTDNTRLLLERGKTDQADETLDRIQSVTDRMGRLGKSLKTFARKPDLSSKPVRVATAVDEMLLLLKPRAEQDGVQIDVDVDGDLVVRAGAVRLGQVLVNLVSNAIDAVVQSEEKQVLVTASIDGAYCLIRVADTGTGINPDLGDAVFEPFVTSKSVGSGLGLGLPIAYNIIRDFGGKLTIVTTSKRGAVFEIRLPLAMPDDPIEQETE